MSQRLPGQATENLTESRTPAEETMAGIWARLFRREFVDVQDDFLDLGGHSLLAMQLISRIREAFGVEVGLRTVFQTSSLAELARRVEAARRAGGKPLMPPLRPVLRNRRMPLSFSQLRQWAQMLLDPHTSAHSKLYAFRLMGALSLGALARSLNGIVSRHETLRTTFTAIDGEPLQVIAPSLELTLAVVDLRQLPPPRRQEEVKRRLRKADRRFDLNRGPLLRAHLLRLDASEHVLLLTVHQIVSDDWSMAVLKWELMTLYESCVARRPSPLPALAIQYTDFAYWQREWFRGEALEFHLDYWRARLADASQVLDLPTDHPRPPLASYVGELETVNLPASLVDDAKACARRRGVTPFMFFLATFKTLLYRLTAQSSLSVGTFAASRHRRQLEPLIGLFVNTLVLHTHLGNRSRLDALTFQELLIRVRDTTLGACEHQDAPFEKVLEELAPERDSSRPLLIQVMLAFRSFPVPAPQPRHLEIRPLDLAEDGGLQLDLSLWVREEKGGSLAAELKFNSTLFDRATARRLLRRFRLLLAAAAADPALKLSELPLLSAAERHQVLMEWNQSFGEYTYERCIHELFESSVKRAPEALAVVDGDRQTTYGALNARVNQLAHHLRAHGVGPETVTAVCVERSLEMVVAMLAVLKAGGAYLPLEPGASPVRRLLGILEDSGTPLLLTWKQLRDELSGPRWQVVCLARDASLIDREDSRDPLPRATAGNAAYVIYTSGSTGRPKGVVVTHRSLVNLVTTAARVYELAPSDRVLQFTSCTFDPSAEEIHTCLVQGATLILRDNRMMASPTEFLRKCRQWGVSILGLPTAYWHELADHLARRGSAPGGSLRLLTIGGERALAERLREWKQAAGNRLRLINCYGPTECTVFATTWEPQPGFAALSMPIGRPIPNVETYLLDRELRVVPIGAPGQLCIAGAGLARAYLDRPGLTAASFTPSRFARQPGMRLYQTGDMARHLTSGAIEFIGRIDQQVKIRGFRVELEEIAAVLRQSRGVKEAIVVAARPDPGKASHRRQGSGKLQLVAYLQLDRRQAPTIPALRAALKQRLPDFMIPAVFVPLAALPLTSSGKVDRKALPAPGTIARETEEGFIAPRKEVEKRLAEIWSHLLEIEQVSTSDSFFDLGGNSLLVSPLLTRVRESFGLELPVRAVFETRTLAEMAADIEKRNLDKAAESSTAGGAASFAFDLAAEAALDPAVAPVGGVGELTASRASILLTGATGFVGAFLLHQLIQRGTAEILCLVRAGSVGEGWDRLRMNLEEYHLWDDLSASRIIPVTGDLSQPLLGLSEQEFRQLAERIEIIYHCGAQISELQPYSTLRLPNVVGTRELLRLACLAKTKAMHHISTLDVFNSSAYSSVGVLSESDSIAHWESLEGGYSQSKWVAEKMVMEARGRGLPASIYRLGAVAGHSSNGASSLEDFTSRYLKSCIQLGMIPESSGTIDLVPVDYVASAIVHLSTRPESLGKVFHVSNPQPLSRREAAELIRSWGYRLDAVPVREWIAALREHVELDPANALAPFLPLIESGSGLLEQIESTAVKVDQHNTRTDLAGTGIVCPPVDRELLQNYFSYFRRSGFLEYPQEYRRRQTFIRRKKQYTRDTASTEP